MDKEAIFPTLFLADIAINNPIFNSSDDPYIEFSDLILKIGRESVLDFALKHSSWVEDTSLWYELSQLGHQRFVDFINEYPSRLPEFYIQAYPLLDDPEFCKLAIKFGFDGAIHPGSGVGLDTLEYRVFSKSQVTILDTKSV